MEPEYLRDRLAQLIAATPETDVTVGFWVGDKAGERRVSDNIRSGRVHWRAARHSALNGIEALDRGDLEGAELLLRNAEGLRAAAIEAQVTQSQFEALLRDAKPRAGKGNERDRDERLADAVEAQISKGLKGPAAREAAIRADPVLQAAFAGKGKEAIAAALRRGRASKSER